MPPESNDQREFVDKLPEWLRPYEKIAHELADACLVCTKSVNPTEIVQAYVGSASILKFLGGPSTAVLRLHGEDPYNKWLLHVWGRRCSYYLNALVVGLRVGSGACPPRLARQAKSLDNHFSPKHKPGARLQRGSDIANFLVTYLDPVLFSTLYYLVVHGDDTDLEIALALVVDEMKNATKDGTTLDIQRVVDEGTIWWGLRVLLDQFGGEFRLGRHVGYKGIAEVCSNLMNGNRRSVICPSVEEATTEATPEIHVEEKTRLRVIQNCAEIAQALESEGGQDLVAKKLWAFSAIQLDCLAGSDVLEEHMYFVGLTLEVLGRLCPDETPSHDQRGRPHARLILFVHGFWGSAEGTWGSFRQLIGDDEALADCDVAFHDYPTSPGKGGLPISVLADGLRTELNNRYAEYNDVVLVCHSLGGLVAKHYLIDEVTREAPLRVTSLVNYAVPHQGVHLASLASMLPGIGKLVAQLARDSDVLQHLQRGWATAPKLEDIVLRDVVASDDRVVERASSQGTPGKADVVLGAGHKSVVKPSRKEDMAFLILRSELLRSQHSAPGR